MAKIDLASKSWCDMVFAGRNQAYGAYQLRSELGHRNTIALIVVCALIVLGLIIPLLIKAVTPKKSADDIQEVTTFSKLKEAEVKDQHIKKVQPKEPQQEVQRIKSEGDYAAARDLVETYGVKVDPELHREMLARYAKLNISPYKGFINPVYTAVKDKEGRITDVKVSYKESYDHQMLRYSKDYSTLPLEN